MSPLGVDGRSNLSSVMAIIGRPFVDFLSRPRSANRENHLSGCDTSAEEENEWRGDKKK